MNDSPALLLRNDQHLTGRFVDDAIGGGAEQFVEPGLTVFGHDDQVRVDGLLDIEQHIFRTSHSNNNIGIR